MNKLILLLLLTSQNLFAQGTVSSTCIWSGGVADCLPSSGLLLRNQRDLRLGEASGNGSNFMAIQSAAAMASDFTLTMPIDDGTTSQFLQTDGNGVLTWAAALINPMTTDGDLIRGGASGAATRVAVGATNAILTVVAGTPTWVTGTGTYTPTFTDGTNGFGTPTPETFHFTRIGNRVNVVGSIRNFTLTAAATSTVFDISLPIATTSLTHNTVMGQLTAHNSFPSVYNSGGMAADSGNNTEVRGYFLGTATTGNFLYVNFSYTIN